MQKAIEYDPEYPITYYVLGRMYRQLPGPPLSIGDVDKAVNLGRYAVRLHEEELQAGKTSNRRHEFYVELAVTLWKRNWSLERRMREQEHKEHEYRKADTMLEKACNYEGATTIPRLTDRSEAKKLLKEVIRDLESLRDIDVREEKDLARARELKERWDIQ